MYPSTAATRLADRDADGGERYCDLQLVLARADHVRAPDGTVSEIPGTRRELARVGGRWDRGSKSWSGDAATERTLVAQAAQHEAAEWLAAWLTRDPTEAPTPSAWLTGGRRGGKSVIGVWTVIARAVSVPGTIAWCISPTAASGDELERAVIAAMPADWYRRSVANGGLVTFHLRNGSTINLKSGSRAARLKAGEVSIGLLNEAQLQSHKAYLNVRGAIADGRGGIVIACANPPDEPKGAYVTAMVSAAIAGEVDAVAFAINPELNPFIDQRVHSSAKKEVDPKTWRREFLGEFTPIGDSVLYTWDPVAHHRNPPAAWVDVTADLTRHRFGRATPYLGGFDPQKSPHMAFVVAQAFASPTTGEWRLWIVDEAIVQGDEHAVVDELEAQGYAGDEVTIVLDASSRWQDGAHSRTTTTTAVLGERGWRHYYNPSPGKDRNPDVLERFKICNSSLLTADGAVRLCVARRCKHTAESLAQYENLHGKPNRRSKFAHVADAVSYLAFRVFNPRSTPFVVDGRTALRAV